MEKFHFCDQNDRLVMVDQMWRSFCDQFNLVISWSQKSVPWPNLHVPWPNRLVIDVEYCTSGASGRGKFVGRGPPARSVRMTGQTGLGRVLHSLVSGAVTLEGSARLVMEQVIGALSLVMLSLLDVLHFVINMRLGEVTVLSLRGATYHTFPFVVLVVLQWDWFDRMDHIFDRRGRMDVANPTFEKMARH
jgi:hypothetical protein